MKLRALFGALLVTEAALAASPSPQDERLLAAMRSELERGRRVTLPGADAPYYVGYWVADRASRSVEGTLGAIVGDSTARHRFVKVDLRVGSRLFDSSNALLVTTDADGAGELSETSMPQGAPIDDDSVVLRRALWLATDAAYKTAAEIFEKKKAGRLAEVASKPEVPSFSEPASRTIVPAASTGGPGEDLSRLCRAGSAVFREFPDVLDSEVRVTTADDTRRLVDTEGTLVVESTHLTSVSIAAETQAEDGMSLRRSGLMTPGPHTPLSTDSVAKEARRIAEELHRLRAAKVAEDFSGPVLFEGRAAAQLVFEMLGEPLSGTPPPGDQSDFEGPLARRLGKRILPRAVSLVDDPTLTAWGAAALLGHYEADDEGVAAERTTLVEDGILRTFLMSRTPREGIVRSNGHGRSGLVGLARGRPANLVLKSTRGLTAAALKSRLLAAIREEEAPYGLVIRELEARSSSTGGQSPPNPDLLYRVDPDGKETLIRGAKLPPLDIRELRRISAVGNVLTAYGFIEESDVGLDMPASVVAPALLFDDLEVRGPSGQNKRPPVVPRPTLTK